MRSTRSAGAAATSPSQCTNSSRITRARNAKLTVSSHPAPTSRHTNSTNAPAKKRKRISSQSRESSNSGSDKSEEDNVIQNPMNSSLEPNSILRQEISSTQPLNQITTAPGDIANSSFTSESHLETEPSSRLPSALPTLSNYSLEETLLKWPKSLCKETLTEMRHGSNNQISLTVKNEIYAAFQRWEHLKMMICLASNITMRMFNKQIGNISPTRKASNYVTFLQYSKINHQEPMPQPNSNDGENLNQLVERNKRVGQAWRALTSDEQEVFSTRLLLALAGIPDFSSEDADNGSEEMITGHEAVMVPEVTQLSPEEEMKYRPIYERLVDHEVVVSKLGTAVPGVSDAKFTRRSLNCIQKINQHMNAEAHRHEFQYWLVAASTVPPLTPGVSGWCKVFTSLPFMTKFITAKANFPTIFGAVAQGKSVLNAVSQASGIKIMAPPSHSNLADKEK